MGDGTETEACNTKSYSGYNCEYGGHLEENIGINDYLDMNKN